MLSPVATGVTRYNRERQSNCQKLCIWCECHGSDITLKNPNLPGQSRCDRVKTSNMSTCQWP